MRGGALHPALVMAREARAQPRAMALELAPPHALWDAADGSREMYRHAMIEAGHVVSKDADEPYNPCPICGHTF